MTAAKRHPAAIPLAELMDYAVANLARISALCDAIEEQHGHNA